MMQFSILTPLQMQVREPLLKLLERSVESPIPLTHLFKEDELVSLGLTDNDYDMVAKRISGSVSVVYHPPTRSFYAIPLQESYLGSASNLFSDSSYLTPPR